jgi:RES domain-containing protein
MDNMWVKIPDHKICHMFALLYKRDDCNDSTSYMEIAIIDNVDVRCTRPTEVGDTWFDAGESVVLRAPSVVLQDEFNLLLNPASPDVA